MTDDERRENLDLHEGIDKVYDLRERLNLMKPFDLTAKCGWDGDVLHVELPEPPKAICVHHPDGTVCFGAPTGVEQELRELCADMWQHIPKTESCGWDMSANTCTGSDECHGECALWYRMRELGVETP